MKKRKSKNLRYYRPAKEKPHAKIRISIILLFIFGTFAICFKYYMEDRGGIMTDDLAKEIFTETESEREQRPDTSKLNPVEASPPIANGYFRSCMIVGNSDIIPSLDKSIETVFIAEGAEHICSAKKMISGSDKELSAERIVNASGKENIYLFFDVTDISVRTEDIKKEMSRFIDSIYSEGRRIYIISSLPSPTPDSELNTHIGRVNAALLETANECGVYYMDAVQFFRKSDGNLANSYADNGKYNQAAAAQLEKTILTHYVLWYYSDGQ